MRTVWRAGSSGSIAAAPSPISSPAAQRARSPPTSCCPRIPAATSDAALAGIRSVLGLAADAPIPPGTIDAVKMGTTVATNALLERKGERTLLVVNRGFADALRIGNQARPRLFDLAIKLPSMLYERVVEIGGRVGVGGRRDREARRGGGARRFRRSAGGRRRGLCHRSDARVEISRARGTSCRAGARGRVRAGLGEPRGLAAAPPCAARRHDGGGCVSLADPAPLRRSGRRRARRRAALLHAIEWRARRGRELPGQGCDPFRSGRRHRRRGAHGGDGRDRAHHRLRHGRHLDRCRALCGRVRTRLRDRDRRRADARADDGDQHRRRGRRLHPAFRRRRASASGRIPPAPIRALPATAMAARSP